MVVALTPWLKSTIVPPACSECNPMSLGSCPLSYAPVGARAVHTAFTMSVFVIWVNGAVLLLWYAHNSVSRFAFCWRRVHTHATHAFTGQHSLSIVWWAIICPLCPFLWLSICSLTRLTCSGYWSRFCRGTAFVWRKSICPSIRIVEYVYGVLHVFVCICLLIVGSRRWLDTILQLF